MGSRFLGVSLSFREPVPFYNGLLEVASKGAFFQ